MRLPKLALVLVLAVAASLPARASSHLTVVGSAQLDDGSCFLIAGVADRRWTLEYWPQGDLVAPGVCDEENDHDVYLTTCRIGIQSPAVVPTPEDPSVFYVSSRARGTTYLFKFVDGGRTGDAAGFATQLDPVPPDDPACGAAEVETTPVSSGGFTILVTE